MKSDYPNITSALRRSPGLGVCPRHLRPRHLPVRSRGAVLMEVLLALALFAAAAAVVTSALNSSLASLERQRLGLHALDLASSTLAEMQLGIRPVASEPVQPFPAPDQDWVREILVAPLEAEGGEVPPLLQVEVVIRHSTASLVQRLAQAFPLGGTGDASLNLPLR